MTEDQKITRVLACCGKAPRSAWALDDAEKAAVAALCGDDGLLVEGGQESFRLLMVAHYERRKATSDEFDPPLRKITLPKLEVGFNYDEAACVNIDQPNPVDSE